MSNFDDVNIKDIKNQNLNWPEVPDHHYRILIIGGSESGKHKSIT